MCRAIPCRLGRHSGIALFCPALQFKCHTHSFLLPVPLFTSTAPRTHRTPLQPALNPLPLQVYAAFRDSAAWERLLAPGQTFSVESRVWSCSNLSSSQAGGPAVELQCAHGSAMRSPAVRMHPGAAVRCATQPASAAVRTQ